MWWDWCAASLWRPNRTGRHLLSSKSADLAAAGSEPSSSSQWTHFFQSCLVEFRDGPSTWGGPSGAPQWSLQVSDLSLFGYLRCQAYWHVRVGKYKSPVDQHKRWISIDTDLIKICYPPVQHMELGQYSLDLQGQEREHRCDWFKIVWFWRGFHFLPMTVPSTESCLQCLPSCYWWFTQVWIHKKYPPSKQPIWAGQRLDLGLSWAKRSNLWLTRWTTV